MVIYGRNPVSEALGAGRRPIERIWAAKPAEWREPIDEARLDRGIVQQADAAEIEDRCGSADHQGVCAQVGDYPYVEEDTLLGAENALVVVLDQVQDPRNLGAVARVAEAAGATGIAIPERRSAEITPAACKTSAGAVEHLPIARVRNVADFLLRAKESDAWVYGAAEGSPVCYDEPDYRGRVVLVMGSEGKGLRPRVADACDQLVSLPMMGRIGSLNISTAAAAILYEILQSRRRA